MTDMPPEFNPETAPPRLSIDWDAYLPLFEDETISDAEKQQVIEALWSIVVSFVDLGFGVHPIQQSCGEHEQELASAIADMLSCDQGNSTNTDQPPSPSEDA